MGVSVDRGRIFRVLHNPTHLSPPASGELTPHTQTLTSASRSSSCTQTQNKHRDGSGFSHRPPGTTPAISLTPRDASSSAAVCRLVSQTPDHSPAGRPSPRSGCSVRHAPAPTGCGRSRPWLAVPFHRVPRSVPSPSPCWPASSSPMPSRLVGRHFISKASEAKKR